MKAYYEDPLATLYLGDCRDVLRELPAESVQCVVTSPPYWALRDYGLPAAVWGGDPEHEHEWLTIVKPAANGIINSAMQGETLNETSGTRKPTYSDACDCGAWQGTFGLEPTPDLFVTHMVEIFREIHRVLRDDGTVWLNLGDSYAGAGGAHTLDHANPGISKSAHRNGFDHYVADKGRGQHKKAGGLKPKDLIGIPWRVAFALQADGWWLRKDIIWSKPNPMPESVTDRPTSAHEYVFLLSKSAKYFYDADAIRENAKPESTVRMRAGYHGNDPERDAANNYGDGFMRGDGYELTSRNRRSVWEIATAPYSEAHFATYPPALVRPCILAGSREGDTVLDPFAGSFTTGQVAKELHRKAIGIELSSDYCDIAVKRITQARVGMALGQ